MPRDRASSETRHADDSSIQLLSLFQQLLEQLLDLGKLAAKFVELGSNTAFLIVEHFRGRLSLGGPASLQLQFDGVADFDRLKSRNDLKEDPTSFVTVDLDPLWQLNTLGQAWKPQSSREVAADVGRREYSLRQLKIEPSLDLHVSIALQATQRSAHRSLHFLGKHVDRLAGHLVGLTLVDNRDVGRSIAFTFDANREILGNANVASILGADRQVDVEALADARQDRAANILDLESGRTRRGSHLDIPRFAITNQS